jgi:hypothetical protein
VDGAAGDGILPRASDTTPAVFTALGIPAGSTPKVEGNGGNDWWPQVPMPVAGIPWIVKAVKSGSVTGGIIFTDTENLAGGPGR